MATGSDTQWSAVNRTAQAVAALRRLEMLRHGERALVQDPTLDRLLEGDGFEQADLAGVALPADCRGDLAAIARWLGDAARDASAARLASHVDRLAIRTARIDALLNEYLREVAQFVIIGAGLDTRAWRLAACAHCRVYEVDFPHVLAHKAARLGDLPLACRERHAVGCDVASPDLGARLVEAGFARGAPTVWLIEGVLVYLTGAQIDALNRSLRELSAPGSRLVATFMGEDTTGMFNSGMISRFDDGPGLLARYGWQARQIHYADIAQSYGRDYPDDYAVYLAFTAPRA